MSKNPSNFASPQSAYYYTTGDGNPSSGTLIGDGTVPQTSDYPSLLQTGYGNIPQNSNLPNPYAQQAYPCSQPPDQPYQYGCPVDQTYPNQASQYSQQLNYNNPVIPSSTHGEPLTYQRTNPDHTGNQRYPISSDGGLHGNQNSYNSPHASLTVAYGSDTGADMRLSSYNSGHHQREKQRTDNYGSRHGGGSNPANPTRQQATHQQASSTHYDDDVETQVDTIFIQNLPSTSSKEQVAEAFGAIGVIKMDKKTRQPRVWIYKDKTTGQGKGEATVTYDDAESANAAIRWFDQKEVLGKTVSVSLAVRKRNTNFKQRGGRRGGGPGGYNRGGGLTSSGFDQGGRNNYGGKQYAGSSDNYSSAGQGDPGAMRRFGHGQSSRSHRPY